MQHDIVLVHSNANDPVVAALLALHETGQLGGRTVTVIHVDELLAHCAPAEWPVVLAADWPPSLGEKFDQAIVFNRVFSLEETACARQLAAWNCSERWLHVRLNELFARAPRRVHDTGVRGVSRSLLPLNTQWFHAQRAQEAMAVPRFAYGFGYEQPDTAGLRDPMQKSIWSLHQWKEERQLSPREASWHRFYVERPAGLPVLCAYFGDDIRLTFPRGEPQVEQSRIDEAIAAVRAVFRSEMGEVLFYVEEDGTHRFHAFSPHMFSAANDPGFASVIGRWVARQAG